MFSMYAGSKEIQVLMDKKLKIPMSDLKEQATVAVHAWRHLSSNDVQPTPWSLIKQGSDKHYAVFVNLTKLCC